MSVLGNFILLAFAGHVHEDGLDISPGVVFAGISLTNLYCNVTFRSVIIGMTGAVETLASQNNGAKNYVEVGVTLQRSVVVTLVIALSFSIWLWAFAEHFFLMLGMDKDLCKVVGVYIKVRMFEMPFSCFNESYEKFLMAIGVMDGPMKANIALNISVTFFCFVFMVVLRLHYAYLGLAWVFGVMIASMVMFLASYHEEAVQRTLQPWAGWGVILNPAKIYQFIELGVPGTLMLCSEWWAYEILTIMGGLLGTAELACMSIILQTCSLFYMIPLGMSVATASLVGNALGAGKKAVAVSYSHLAVKTILVTAVLSGAFIYFGAKYIGLMFTSDHATLHEIEPVSKWIPLFFLFDALQGVESGILRGAGQQLVGAVTNLFAFYGLALPTAWLLCFNANLRTTGLMLGISCGTATQSAALTYLIYRKEGYIFRSQLDAAGGSGVPGAGEQCTVDEELGKGGGGDESEAVASHFLTGRNWFGGGGRDRSEGVQLTMDYSKHDQGILDEDCQDEGEACATTGVNGKRSTGNPLHVNEDQTARSRTVEMEMRAITQRE
tara:strand:- start:743 stop:2398 length:1656 start_codon:yes stop_codon:yes gene_type:complete